MILAWLIIIPAAGGLIAWYSGRFGQSWPRRISVTALIMTLALVVTMLAHYQGGIRSGANQPFKDCGSLN